MIRTNDAPKCFQQLFRKPHEGWTSLLWQDKFEVLNHGHVVPFGTLIYFTEQYSTHHSKYHVSKRATYTRETIDRRKLFELLVNAFKNYFL